MTRFVAISIVSLGLWVSLPSAQGQQVVPPVARADANQDPSSQTASPASATQTPASDDGKQVILDPKTGLPLTAAEIREKEIDKIDPMKANAPAADPNANRLTDRNLPTAPANYSNPYASKDSAPLPGSVAASNAGSSQTPANSLTADNTANGPEYTGPAVLSRSYTLSRPMGMQQIKWRVSFGFSYSWDQGQAAVLPNSTGGFTSPNTQSRGYTWGLNGRHTWKHDQLGVAYSGGYSDYSTNSFSGMNNSLNLDFAHTFSRRLSFQLVESLQSLSQNYSLENPVLEPGSSVANINLATSPNLQLAGNSVRQSNSTASMTFHQTNRLSYDLSASTFVVGRTGAGFVGTTGNQTSGDLNYRLTSKATVGAFYSYTQYQFSHNIARSDSHSAGAIFSYALNRRTQLRSRFGATRIEGLGYQTVALPPQLAAILGQASTIVNAYSLRTISDVSAELVRDFGRSRTASLGYTHGQSPGNGVLLTSYQQTINAGYSTRLLRRVPVSVGYNYSTLTTLSQNDLGNYSNQTWYFGTSREIRRGVSTSFRVDYRMYNLSNSPLSQHDLRFSVSLTWSPPDNSVRF